MRTGSGLRLRAAVVAALVGIALCAASVATASEQTSRCPEPPAVASNERPPASDPATLARDDPIRVAFDGKRGMTDKTVTATALRPLPATAEVIAEVESDFERGDGGDTFPLEAISVSARVTRAGNVRVFLCLDSERPEHVEIGRYLGAIRLIGSDIEPLALPVEVTLKDSNLIAIVWIVIGLVFGLALKTATDFNTSGATLTKDTLRGFLRQPAPYLALLTGIVGGVLSYTQLYATNPAWGTNEDHVKLMLAGVAIQVTGMTATDLISPYAPGRGRRSDAPAAPPAHAPQREPDA